jgi:hypothetical protein
MNSSSAPGIPGSKIRFAHKKRAPTPNTTGTLNRCEHLCLKGETAFNYDTLKPQVRGLIGVALKRWPILAEQDDISGK